MSFKGFFFGLIKFCALIVSLMVVGALSTFITLRLFTSGDEVVVPDLAGKDPVEAIQVLKQYGLQLKIMPQKRFNDRVPADKIVFQRPEAKSKIKQGRSISVYISLGPEKAIVPDLAGQTTRVANMTLQQKGLHAGKVIYISAPGSQSDEVLAQFPEAGTELVGNKIVNLLVNHSIDRGEVYVMPDVIGKELKAVTSYFRSEGFAVGSAQPVNYPGVAGGTIVKQNPPAGFKLSKTTVIGLYYSK